MFTPCISGFMLCVTVPHGITERSGWHITMPDTGSGDLTLTKLKYFCKNHGDNGLFQFEIFEYLCYQSMTI